MSVWGMNHVVGDEHSIDCGPEPPGTTAKKITATSCWFTGKTASKIFWERRVLDGDAEHSLSFEYDEELRALFDPIITHVNTSWTHHMAP